MDTNYIFWIPNFSQTQGRKIKWQIIRRMCEVTNDVFFYEQERWNIFYARTIEFENEWDMCCY